MQSTGGCRRWIGRTQCLLAKGRHSLPITPPNPHGRPEALALQVESPALLPAQKRKELTSHGTITCGPSPSHTSPLSGSSGDHVQTKDSDQGQQDARHTLDLAQSLSGPPLRILYTPGWLHTPPLRQGVRELSIFLPRCHEGLFRAPACCLSSFVNLSDFFSWAPIYLLSSPQPSPTSSQNSQKESTKG